MLFTEKEGINELTDRLGESNIPPTNFYLAGV